MTINVEIEKNSGENPVSVVRRFSRRVQEAGVLPRVRSIRYRTREESKLKRKRSTLKMIARKKEFERLRKLGKLPEATKKRR